MAFRSNNNAAVSQPNNDSWKAQGFINLYLPADNPAGRKKLGAIPLKEAKPTEAPLLAWLNEDPSRVDKLLAVLQMEYQPATVADGNGFVLPE